MPERDTANEDVLVKTRKARGYQPAAGRPERTLVDAAKLAAENAARGNAVLDVRRETQRMARVYSRASRDEIEAALSRAAIARGVPIEL